MNATRDDARWELLARREPGADGSFWYGVKTTGVFCRPSCPSRLPKRWGAERKRALLEHEAAQAGGEPGGRPRVRAPR